MYKDLLILRRIIMKRFVSLLLIILMISSVMAVMSISVFAADGAESAIPGSSQIKDLLDKVKAYVPLDTLKEFKNELELYVKALIVFIKSEETYKNIATAILAVLAFLFIPIVIGVVVIVYLAAALMAAVSTVVVGIVEVILTVLVGLIPAL
jgi:putative effector of murein hydrolase LrgA (UPF0299 family)